MGRDPVQLEASEWAGTWLHEEGAFAVRVADGQSGRLQVAWIEEEDGGLEMKSLDAHLRRFEDWLFVSFPGEEDDRPEGTEYLWMRLVRDGELVHMWWPRPEAFRRLVEEGALPGKVEDGDVFLGQLGADHLALIVSEERGVLFAWGEPMVFQRYRGGAG